VLSQAGTTDPLDLPARHVVQNGMTSAPDIVSLATASLMIDSEEEDRCRFSMFQSPHP